MEGFLDLESVEKSWLVSLRVKNLMDEEYIIGGRQTLDEGGGLPGPGRNFGITGRYRF